MTPDLYAIQYARSSQEVLSLLGRCVDYVRSGPVLALLPDELQGLRVHDQGDVEVWQPRLGEILKEGTIVTASARCWIVELAEVFSMASDRLHALGMLPPVSRAGDVPVTRRNPVGEILAQARVGATTSRGW